MVHTSEICKTQHGVWIFDFKVFPSEMETEVILKFSSTDITKFSNFSDTTTKSTSVEETFKWRTAEIARLIQIIIRQILILVGTLGNCLSFYVMRRTSLKHVKSCFYMSLLCKSMPLVRRGLTLFCTSS